MLIVRQDGDACARTRGSGARLGVVHIARQVAVAGARVVHGPVEGGGVVEQREGGLAAPIGLANRHVNNLDVKKLTRILDF